MDKKSSMMKDAIILCAITLILGVVLAGVYMLTKSKIEGAQADTNKAACAVVVAQGDSVKDNDAEAVSGAAAYLSKHDLSNAEVKEGDLLSEYVEITEVHPTANGGKVYLANALKGYGGKISFALGVDAQSAITGIEITSESETAVLVQTVKTMSLRRVSKESKHRRAHRKKCIIKMRQQIPRYRHYRALRLLPVRLRER